MMNPVLDGDFEYGGFPRSVEPAVVRLVLCFQVVSYAFETVLDLRQLAVLERPEMRPEFKGLVSLEKFQQARAYSLDRMRLHLVHSLFSLLQNLATLVLGLLPFLWKATQVDWQLGSIIDARREIEHSLLFLAASASIDMVVELPFSLYSTFVVEARHGFNKQTLALFFADMAKGIVLTAVIGAPVLSAIIAIVRVAGPFLVPSLWLFSLAVSLFLLTIYPIVIAPLFNTFVPLEAGPLRTSIEKLASSLKFPLTRIFVVDGSTRSAHSNAYLYGFFNNKRVVLYDTLIKQCSEEEVVAVLAHEMGHWKLRHTLKNFLVSQVLMLFNFAGYSLISTSKDLFSAFGFSACQPVVIGFLLFQLITIPVNHVLTFTLNAISRHYEFQADAFAVKLGYASSLRAGLIKLQEENKSTMNTDPLYSTYHYSHPPFTERLAAIDAKSLEKKNQ